MSLLSFESLSRYWSIPEMSTNLIVFLNLLGALLLGLLVGYERSYHGRAAGMRTYGLVCMASAALTVIVGYPGYWFGGEGGTMLTAVDPTHVIQGIITGIGFLGAGVILKDGFSISGLTTAASIWAASAIGILIGIGFYAAGILLALLSVLGLMWGTRLEGWLPSRPAVSIRIRFRKYFEPREDELRRVALDRGYEIAEGSISINYQEGQPEWHFVAIEVSKNVAEPIAALANELSKFDGVVSYTLSPARN
ncbi:MAG: MgtC/SapB family protein [Rhodocyclaceae bacterium]|nr:MAG: MgtC/SapB family protein [Rhodocyclaceae bacterium]